MAMSLTRWFLLAVLAARQTSSITCHQTALGEWQGQSSFEEIWQNVGLYTILPGCWHSGHCSKISNTLLENPHHQQSPLPLKCTDMADQTSCLRALINNQASSIVIFIPHLSWYSYHLVIAYWQWLQSDTENGCDRTTNDPSAYEQLQLETS